MGVPDDFRLTFGTRRDRIRLLGNGVCPPVMAAVVRTLLDSPRSLLPHSETITVGRQRIGRAKVQLKI